MTRAAPMRVKARTLAKALPFARAARFAKALPLAAGLVLAIGAGTAQAVVPLLADSMGPISDVTSQWQHYQPASAFCIQPDAPQFTPGGTGATATGHDPACSRSGFSVSATGLVKVAIATPALCAGCRRLFIDFSKIPASGGARGHAYYHLAAVNFTYTVNPVAHSPNTKNFTNDKLLAPPGSLQEQILAAIDLHAIAYVADTAFFVHNAIQGPYYIGPWYLNGQGDRIHGVYLDVPKTIRFPIAQLNQIHYAAGFNSGQLCPSDADLLYAGCFDAAAFSVSSVDPFA